MILAGFFMHLLANRRLQKSFTFDLRKVGWGPPESPLESFLFGGQVGGGQAHIHRTEVSDAGLGESRTVPIQQDSFA